MNLVLVMTMSCLMVATAKRFIIRHDDVEDWFNNQVQADLLNYWMDHNIPVTAVVLSNYIGKDPMIMSVLQRCVSLGPHKCALGSHSPAENEFFKYVQNTTSAYHALKQTDDKIKQLFPGYQYSQVFVPPENYYNQYAIEALKLLKYPVISASTAAYSGMTWDLTTYPMQMPQQAGTGNYAINATGHQYWFAFPLNTTLAACDAAYYAGQDCVIMVHPHEFANGAYTFDMLKTLINALYAKGYTATNFHTVINEVLHQTDAPTAAPTVAPTFGPGQKKYIFRQDNVQDYYHSSTQVQLLNFFMDNNIPITANILGQYFGSDNSLMTAMKRCVSLGPDKCALGNQGLLDSKFFQTVQNTTAALAAMQKCDAKIQAAFPGYPYIQVFSPPQNVYNTFTMEAVKLMKYPVVSASVDSYSGMKWDLSSTPLQMPQQIATATYAVNAQGKPFWIPTTINQTLTACEIAVKKGADCVITIHPDEFASGAYTITMLQQLISTLNSNGYSGVTFHSRATQILSLTDAPTLAPTTAPKDDPTTKSDSSASIDFLNPNAYAILIYVIGGFIGLCGVYFLWQYCRPISDKATEIGSTRSSDELIDPNELELGTVNTIDFEKYLPKRSYRYSRGKDYDEQFATSPMNRF